MEGTQANPIVIGSSPSPPPGRPLWNSPEASLGYVDNANSELEVSTTGNSSSDYPAHSDSHGSRYRTSKFRQTFIQRLTASPPDLSQPRPTCGKKTLPSMELDSNSVRRAFNATALQTGNASGNLQNPDDLWTCQQMCEYVIMAPCRESLQTALSLLRSSVPQLFIGGLQEQAKLGEPGKRPAWKLTLKIPGKLLFTIGPSGFADIEISHTLYSMSSGEPSIYRTYSDGWIATQYVWKLRGLRDLSWPPASGSHPTYHRADGTQNWMMYLKKH